MSDETSPTPAQQPPKSSLIRVRCPNKDCNAVIGIRTHRQQKEVQCPQCGTKLVVGVTQGKSATLVQGGWGECGLEPKASTASSGAVPLTIAAELKAERKRCEKWAEGAVQFLCLMVVAIELVRSALALYMAWFLKLDVGVVLLVVLVNATFWGCIVIFLNEGYRWPLFGIIVLSAMAIMYYLATLIFITRLFNYFNFVLGSISSLLYLGLAIQSIRACQHLDRVKGLMAEKAWSQRPESHSLSRAGSD